MKGNQSLLLFGRSAATAIAFDSRNMIIFSCVLVQTALRKCYHSFCAEYYVAESTTPAGYNYTCKECGASFEAMEDLTKHCREDHTHSQ
jgi:hypothetical protein